MDTMETAVVGTPADDATAATKAVWSADVKFAKGMERSTTIITAYCVQEAEEFAPANSAAAAAAATGGDQGERTVRIGGHTGRMGPK